MKTAQTRRIHGAAEKNRTSDPVITNEGNGQQTRSFPTSIIPETPCFDTKLRKSAQELMRKLRPIQAVAA